MATRFTCPHCSAALRLAQEVPAGKKIKCPQCERAFLAENGAVDEGIRSGPARHRAPVAGHEDEEPRPRRKSKKKSQKGLNPLVVIVPVAALLVLLIVGGGIAAVVLLGGKDRKAVAKTESPTPPVAAAPGSRNPGGANAPAPAPAPTPIPGLRQGDLPGPGQPNAAAPPPPTGPVTPAEPAPAAPSAPPPKNAGTRPGTPGARVGLNVGDLAMEIDGEDIDGNKFRLSDYRGKVVVLDFWGHW